MVYRSRLYETLKHYVLYGTRTRNGEVPYAVADALLGDVIESVRARRCPYCGKVFANRAMVRRHLSADHSSPYCKAALKLDIERAVDAYVVLKKLIRKNHYMGRCRGLIYRLGEDGPEFRSKSDVGRWIRENPEHFLAVVGLAPHGGRGR